jgi:hypothetical protein
MLIWSLASRFAQPSDLPIVGLLQRANAYRWAFSSLHCLQAPWLRCRVGILYCPMLSLAAASWMFTGQKAYIILATLSTLIFVGYPETFQ